MASRKTPADTSAETAAETAVPEVLDFPGQVTSMDEYNKTRALSRQEAFSDEELRGISSFEDAFALATSIYGDVIDVTEELGNGFTLISDKKPLVDTKFMILSCGFNEGDFGTFVSIAAVTTKGDKYIFNDGSRGVHDQLFELCRTKGRTGGFLAPNGLTESTYDTCPAADGGCSKARPKAIKKCQHCGNESEQRGTATTYFLNLAPA